MYVRAFLCLVLLKRHSAKFPYLVHVTSDRLNFLKRSVRVQYTNLQFHRRVKEKLSFHTGMSYCH